MTDETRKDNGLGLADVLQHLGGELREAQRRGGGTIAWMSAEVEMELAVETTVRRDRHRRPGWPDDL